MKPGSPISEAVWLAHDFLSLRFVTDRCTCEDKTANPPSAHWVPTGVWSPSRSCVPAPNGLLILYRLRNMFGDADLPMLLLWSRRNKKLLLPPVHAHAVKKKKIHFKKPLLKCSWQRGHVYQASVTGCQPKKRNMIGTSQSLARLVGVLPLTA